MLKHSLVNLDSGFQITLHGWGGGTKKQGRVVKPVKKF